MKKPSPVCQVTIWFIFPITNIIMFQFPDSRYIIPHQKYTNQLQTSAIFFIFIPISITPQNGTLTPFIRHMNDQHKLSAPIILSLNLRLSLNINRTQSMASWKRVTYSSQNKVIPQERWGHRFVRVSPTEIAMFGGYGSCSKYGKYFDDVWTYNIIDNLWTKIATSGNKPQGRSNYSLHFNQPTEEIILFGGGAANKARFNDVRILNWKTKVWSLVSPKQDCAVPWQRTYHSSEFIYPYLIVFGGQSLSHFDSKDMWVFNIITEEWRQLTFDEDKLGPCSRRFHSSALIDGFFYVIAGCQGSKYTLLGDIYRVDLNTLISQDVFNNLSWECVITNNQQLKRWGHSTDVYQQCIYIACGRKEQSVDSDQLFVFNHKSLTFSQYKARFQEKLKPRRKHSSIIIGNSLLIYGGYNGKYLQDFDYINLQLKNQIESSKIRVIPTDSIEETMKQLTKIQQQPSYNLILRIILNSKVVMKLKTKKQLLRSNPFFRYMIQNETGEELTITLPQFSDLLSFRMIHAATISKSIPLSDNENLNFYKNLLKSAQYFCSFEIYQPIQQTLLRRLDEDSCEQIYHLGVDLQLQTVKQSAAELILVSKDHSQHFKYSQWNQGASKVQQSCKHLKDTMSSEYLCQLYSKVKFDVQQKRLQNQNQNILFKTANKIRHFFSCKKSATVTSEVVESQVQDNNKGCLTEFVEFVSRICSKAKVEPQQFHQN